MDDVLIVGAGPAGAVAAIVLARAGARVRILERAIFPRDKLCGDSLNPGTLDLLRRLNLLTPIEPHGLRLDGMLLTGLAGDRLVAVEGRYPPGLSGRSINRRDLDWALLQAAVAAGATFEQGVTVRHAVASERRGVRYVTGVSTGANGSARVFQAPITIAADGRRSALAFGLGQARHPASPRRWAIGAYFEHTEPELALGEMHIRRDRYIGIAPIPGGVNVCVVKPSGAADPDLHDPEETIRRELRNDPALRDRFADLRLVRSPLVLGPLAVDASGDAIDGLIAAGDAAGFIDPMTGDGLRFAVRGGELAAIAALRVLEHGWSGVHARLVTDRRREFGAKWRFNRMLRAVVASPLAVGAAATAARVTPGVVRAMVRYAGDCGLVTPPRAHR